MSDESQIAQNRYQDVSEEELPGLYTRWRARVHNWLSDKSRDELADAVLLLPDLFALAIRLISDPRTPLHFKSQLLMVSGYVLLPVDLIPEAALGAAGLADDAIILSVVLLRLVQNATQIDHDLLREHWEGKGDIVATLQDIVDSKGEIMNTRIWNRLRTLLGIQTPDPAVVEDRQDEAW